MQREDALATKSDVREVLERVQQINVHVNETRAELATLRRSARLGASNQSFDTKSSAMSSDDEFTGPPRRRAQPTQPTQNQKPSRVYFNVSIIRCSKLNVYALTIVTSG